MPHPSAAPLPIDVGGALRPFGRSTMLPAEAYRSDAVLAWERRHLFAAAWTCVGRTAELSAGVTQRAVGAGDVGVLLTFTSSGVRAFANLCRHRGHELLGNGGTHDRVAIVCPYHGWAYDLTGALTTAAAMRGVPGFATEDHGLIELPVAQWHGWLFVNGTGQAGDFTGYVGALDSIIAPYRPAELRPVARHEYPVAANWKLIVENYHECYHCPQIHPELCRISPPSSGDNWDLPGMWVGGTMDLRPQAQTMSLDGRSRGQFIAGAPTRTVAYVGLFPNLLISAHPDYVMTHRLIPVAPGLTTVECCWYMPEGVDDARYAVDFWDVTNREDWAACESVHRGVCSPHFVPGPLAPAEDAVYQWVSLIARAYQDPATVSGSTP